MKRSSPLRITLSAVLLSCVASGQTWQRTSPLVAGARVDATVSDAGTLTVFGVQSGETVLLHLDPNGEVTQSRQLIGLFGERVAIHDATYASNGDLLVCGSVSGVPYLAAIDPTTGYPIWRSSFTLETGKFESVLEMPDGNVLAAGSIIEPGTLNSWATIVATDPTGQVLSAANHSDPGPTQLATSLSLSPDGTALHTIQGTGVVVQRLDSTGSIVSRITYTNAGTYYNARVGATSDGGAYVAGLHVDATSGQAEYLVLRLDAAGEVVWSRSYEGEAAVLGSNLSPEVLDVAEAPDGGARLTVLQAVDVAGDARRDLAVLAIDAGGEPLWFRSFGDAGETEYAGGAVLTPDGGVLAVSLQADDAVRIVRTDPNGFTSTCTSLDLSIQDDPESPVVDDDTGFDPLPLAVFDSGAYSWGYALAEVTDLECGVSCSASGFPFGIGTPGTGGIVPSVSVSDGACLGFGPTVAFEDVRGGTFGVLAFGMQTTALPLFGGQLYVDPTSLLLVALTTDGTPGSAGAGTASYGIVEDMTPLMGLTIYGQAVFRDTGSPFGWVLSPGIGILPQ